MLERDRMGLVAVAALGDAPGCRFRGRARVAGEPAPEARRGHGRGAGARRGGGGGLRSRLRDRCGTGTIANARRQSTSSPATLGCPTRAAGVVSDDLGAVALAGGVGD